ncbi:MAG: prepilin-type N-terminal cleavage/methylation domain-containing protein [Planctomycetota bacterium]
MQRTASRPGFTFVELLVVLFLIGMLLPALGAARRTSRQMSNNTQLRGIHQSFVTFAQSNKVGGNDGYFPGLDARGELTAVSPAGRMNLLLNGNYFTPDYIVSPADTDTVVAVLLPGQEEYAITTQNHSYAMLRIGDAAADAGRRDEWKETLNANAIVLSDRNTGTPDRLSSVWTERLSGDWRGGVVRNDNSTAFELTTVFEATKYGRYAANDEDAIFVGETDAGSDTLNIHEIEGLAGR